MKRYASPAIRTVARAWKGHLAHFRAHRNSEHLEALLNEAARFTGLQLEIDLEMSAYWSAQPLLRRALVLLYLVDRGVVERRMVDGRACYEPTLVAESWISRQHALIPYLMPTLELVAALRKHQVRRELKPKAR